MSRSPLHLTHGAFDRVVNKPGIVILDFWAPWCGPCRAFAPVFERAAEKHADVTFAKVNTDDEGRLAQEWSIQAIPTVMAFKDGVPVFSQPGVLPERALDSLIDQLRALDMAVVRRELAKGSSHAGA
jgi:thioredoxin 1